MQQRADDDDDAVLFQEIVDRRQERVADRLAFARRVEHFQQRRQHRDAGQERDQHAGAGDLAEFRDALVVGRQEAEESGRGRHRGERQRNRGALGRTRQRLRQIVVLETLRTVADAELDAEIHAQADEQHGKRDRQQIERTHHHQADRRGDRKPDEQIHETRRR